MRHDNTLRLLQSFMSIFSDARRGTARNAVSGGATVAKPSTAVTTKAVSIGTQKTGFIAAARSRLQPRLVFIIRNQAGRPK